MPATTAHEDWWEGVTSGTGTDDAGDLVSGPLATIEG